MSRRADPSDLEAFEAVYRDHHRRVWALASRWERDARSAEELLQDVFVRVWRALPDFRGESALSTWIHSIAVRTAMDRARHDRRREGRERAAGADRPVAAEPVAAEAVDLERAIAALPDGQRRMFILHAIEGYRCREIADRMGVATGTVQSQVFRAREKLKEVLER
jgi:RNA polymerase sigma-70 factor (ECF subfamily)